MQQAVAGETGLTAPVIDILARERRNSLTPREWRFRLAGHGYAIKDIGGRQVVTSLIRGTELGDLPTQFC